MFGQDFFNDLLLLAKIRNRFAHEINAKDFSDQRISSWLKNMKVYQLLPGMVERAMLRADEEKNNLPPRKEPGEPHSISASGYYFIVKGISDDPQSSFRFCIDMMIHQLDKCADNMTRNLANLQHDWMTADERMASKAVVKEEQPSP
jgi:hypothetical protein